LWRAKAGELVFVEEANLLSILLGEGFKPSEEPR